MSADYEILVERPLSEDAARALLMKSFPRLEVDGAAWCLPHSTVRFSEVEADDIEWMTELFGVRPSFGLRFSNTSTPTGHETMRCVIRVILDHLGGDGVLIFNGETPMWERRDSVERDLTAG